MNVHSLCSSWTLSHENLLYLNNEFMNSADFLQAQSDAINFDFTDNRTLHL